MDPVAALSAIFAVVDWKKIAHGLATDAAKKGIHGLLGRLKPDERDKAAKQVLEFFVQEFLTEVEDKAALSSAVGGYRDQLKRLIEHAAPEITGWLQPETKEVDLGPVERMWGGLGLDPLPEDFDWALLSKNFARDIRNYVRSDPALRERLNTALLERQTELQENSAESLSRLAGVGAGFDLAGYRDYLRKKCAVLQLSAIHTSAYDRRIGLWNIFVPQSARKAAPARDVPREVMRRLRREGHIEKEKDENEIERLRDVYQSSPVSPVLDVLASDRLVVVLGDPGSGKTSLLKFLAMRWVSEDAGPLPVWIDLKEYAQGRGGFLKYFESGCATYGLDAREIERLLRTGRAAFYLDGLDEIFEAPARGSVVEEIAAVAARYAQAPVVVTSRVLGYESDRLSHAGFTHATLEEFDDEQVSEFLAKWHEAAEEDEKQRARLESQLKSALRESRAVRELAGNPLLLMMMAILNRTQALPRDRVELYAQASRVLLHEWDASRSLPVDTFGRQEKEALLRELAGAMQQGDGGLAGNLIDRSRLIEVFRAFLRNLGVPGPYERATSLVRQLTERNFILCFTGADRFSFVHRTFLEYFCAAWFVDLFEKKQTLTLEQLKQEVFGQHWKDEAWHEVLRLIAGMVGEKQAEELIRFLMAQDGRRDKFANLMLAAGCLSEVRNRRAIQETDEALWRRFVEEVVRYDPPYYYNPFDEYSEVGTTREKAVGLLALAWTSERTCQWLKAAAERDTDWIVRQAAIQELASRWKTRSEMLLWLKERAQSDPHFAVRRAAVESLARGWKEDPETLPWIKECARSDSEADVRLAAVEAAAWNWKDDVQILPWLKTFAQHDEDENVRLTAVAVLARHWRSDPDALSILKECIRLDKSEFARQEAVRELVCGWKNDPETLNTIWECVRPEENPIVRVVAAQQLARGWTENPEILRWLKESAHSDKHFAVRWATMCALVWGWKDDPDTLAILKECVRSDEHPDVRAAAIEELARGWKDDPETLYRLKERAHADENQSVRLVAIEELARGWEEDPEILCWLKERVRADEHEPLRWVALQQLARGWKDDPDTLPVLKESARSDKHEYMRWVAVEELARGWRDDPETLPILTKRARSDESDEVRQEAVRELARGWRDDPETLAILKERACSDESDEVKTTAVQELARGWKEDPEVIEMLRLQAS